MTGFFVVIIISFFVWQFFRAAASRHGRRMDTPSPVDFPSSPPMGRTARLSGPRQEPTWIAAGQSLSVAGTSIHGGMVYFGTPGHSSESFHHEPALIDPTLPVDFNAPDRDGAHMGYWPSYSSIHRGSRAAYLNWLASGRSSPSTNIGYVFLFFYGLERRLFVDDIIRKSEHERTIILAEIQRLRSIYTNRSFQGYSGRLLDFVNALSRVDADVVGSAPEFDAATSAVPLSLVVGLAQLSSLGRAIPSDWALSWVLQTPETRLRTPARRCRNELEKLFHIRYRERFGEGMIVKPNKTFVTLEYRPASSLFTGSVKLNLDPPLPDITRLKAPLRKLIDLLEECTTELEAFSRWRGKNPDAEIDLAALALLPRELAEKLSTPQANELSSWLSSVLVDERASIDAADLLNRWAPGVPKLSRSESVLLAEFLSSKDVGVEPDVRFGGPPLSSTTRAVLFRNPAGSPQTPSPVFKSATVLLQLTAAVMQADGVDDAEIRQVEEYLNGALPLIPSERDRLFAHLAWLLENPPKTSGLKRRIQDLDARQRQDLGQFLISVAGADGVVTPAEVRMLEKVYPLLGLDRNEVFAHIHGLSTAESSAAPHETFSPPAAALSHSPEKQDFALDMGRVEARMRETAAVTELLGSIFATDEAATGAPAPSAPPADVDLIEGLDAAHSRLLRELPSQATISREELELLASTHGVLPDGAIETVNERAFEACDEPLFEGDDPLEINLAVLEEMLQ